MTAQAILTTTAIAIITIFTVSFCLDLITTLRQAWKNASPKSQIIPMEETALIKLTAPTPTLPTCATLEWIVSQPDETGEALNVIDLAKTRQRKPVVKPIIETLPQTKESQALHEWLSVAPSLISSYSTPRPDYSKMTVKQLRVEAKIRNVKNASSLPKKFLVAALQIA